MQKRPRKFTRPALLAAIPIKNELVKETVRTEKSLRLTAPLKPTALSRLFKSPNAPASTKSFDLDRRGMYVWDHLDGSRTISDLIAAFAVDHGITAAESETAILEFLHMLTRRNLIALIAPDQAIELT